MNKKDWMSDDPAYAPVHAVRVWLAHTASDIKAPVRVSEGFFDRGYSVWRFDNGDRVSIHGHHVVGWLPIDRPTYEE